MSCCPGEGTLRLVGTDALDDADFAAIEEHVEGCTECNAILERLAHRRSDSSAVLPGPDRMLQIPGFTIKHELGRGLGVVYLAVRTGGLERPCALKVLPARLGADQDPSARRRWLREARAVASVRHPNVVTLYDYGEANGWFYLVLEYVSGGTLKNRLGDPLPPRVATRLLETMSRAVGCLHGLGLVHLDLKPSNILMDGDESAPLESLTPKISDFGLARSDEEAGPSETSLAGIRGTPSYMAPEQANARHAEIGPAADIYALGAVLYELLTGRPPFKAGSIPETIDQVRQQEPIPPRRLVPKLPRDLETIALKCLEKSPSRRYASAVALADDLRRWLEGHSIEARPVTSLEKIGRWCRRRPGVAALAASLMLTLCFGFLSVVVLWRRAEAERARAEADHLQAEADFQIASEMLGQIVDLSTGGQLHLPKAVSPDQTITLMAQTRKHLLDLARRRPDQETLAWQIRRVENRLFACLTQQGRSGAARSLIEESLTNTEQTLKQSPGDRWRIFWRARCFEMLAQVAMSEHSIEESVNHLRQAVRSAKEVIDVMPEGEQVNFLAEQRRALARMLSRVTEVL